LGRTIATALFVVAALGASLGRGSTVGTAQSYPPPCGPGSIPCPPGSSDPGTTTNTPPQGSASPVATPFCDLAHCLVFAGQVGDTFVANQVEEEGDFRVTSVSGCCDRGARVDIYMESERIFLGTVFAAEDGSYQATFKVPASVTAGKHHVIADIEGCGELRREIEVLGAMSDGSAPPGGGSGGGGPGSSGDDSPATVGTTIPEGDGTTVLGTTVRNTGDGGLLPLSGGDLIGLLLWGSALALVGTVLMRIARKRGFRYTWLRIRGHEAVDRRYVLALPPPEVPFVDTSRFIPFRSRVEDSLRSPTSTTMTGWDEPRNDSLG
jgi:hypothetical protein